MLEHKSSQWSPFTKRLHLTSTADICKTKIRKDIPCCHRYHVIRSLIYLHLEISDLLLLQLSDFAIFHFSNAHHHAIETRRLAVRVSIPPEIRWLARADGQVRRDILRRSLLHPRPPCASSSSRPFIRPPYTCPGESYSVAPRGKRCSSPGENRIRKDCRILRSGCSKSFRSKIGACDHWRFVTLCSI